MDAPQLARVLRRGWWLVVVAVLLAVGGAALVTQRTTPTYVATARIYISSTGGPKSSALEQILTQSRATSFVNVANSPLVAQKVIDRLHLSGISASQIADRVTAVGVNGSSVIDVSVSDTLPGRAQRIANALAPELNEAVNELEDIDVAGDVPIKVTVLRPAMVPDQPVSPKPLRNYGIAVVLGLLIGLGVSGLREALNSTLRTPEELTALTSGTPQLGAIPFDRAVRKRPLLVPDPGRVAISEAFRRVRTNARFIDVGTSCKVWVVTSSVPGEGKSVVSTNLSVVLGQSGLRVCLVDADLRKPRVADYLDMDGGVGLSSVLSEQVSLDDALQSRPEDGGITVLTSGPVPPNPSELLGSEQMQHLLDELRTRFDFVLLDTPPLLPVTDAAVLARLTDGALLVVAHARTRRHQVALAAEALATVDARLIGTLLSAMRDRRGLPFRRRRGYGYGYGYGYSERSPRKVRATRSGKRVKPTSSVETTPAVEQPVPETVPASEAATSGGAAPSVGAVPLADTAPPAGVAPPEAAEDEVAEVGRRRLRRIH